MWESEAKGWLLSFKIDGIGPKNNELGKMFGLSTKRKILHTALDDKAQCYILPSLLESNKSSIAAPMTVLLNFIEGVEEISLTDYPDFAWATIEEAIDPSYNVHAGVIADYCQKKDITDSKMLGKYGWTPKEMLVSIELPKTIDTLQKLGNNTEMFYKSIKNLLVKNKRVKKQGNARSV